MLAKISLNGMPKNKVISQWIEREVFSNKIWFMNNIWEKVFKSGLNKLCGSQPLKNFKGYGLLEIFERLPSTKFTWSTLEYFASSLTRIYGVKEDAFKTTISLKCMEQNNILSNCIPQ